MSSLDVAKARDLLHQFDFKPLFIEQLGWGLPKSNQAVKFSVGGVGYQRRQIAELGGVVVLEVTADDGTVPGAKARVAIQKEISNAHHENLLIFLDKSRSQSLWYWVKRQDGNQYGRDHLYVKGQPGDLFLSKINAMFVDIRDLDEQGNLPVVEVSERLRKALDVEHVTKKFYGEFREEHIKFLEHIEGIGDERDRRWYASILLNRLMFIYFMQRKGFLNKRDLEYLQHGLKQSKKNGKDRYYTDFLKPLFFEGFAELAMNRSEATQKLLGDIPYLNGGLFLKHAIEERWPKIKIPDLAFENMLMLFARYDWNLNDTPGGQDDEINPDVLGYIFEKYINQKAFGAYYTRPEITEYLCERTISRVILEKVERPGMKGVLPARHFDTLPEMLIGLDAQLCKDLLFEVLPKLSLLDPACGSGAFLVAAMKLLIDIYSAIVGRIDFLSDPVLTKWLADARKAHASINYYIKKRIITDNLFGVDIMEEATEIARLRLFLALVASAQSVSQLEPLPNIDFNILAGNSLIGLLRVDESAFNKTKPGQAIQDSLLQKAYHEIVAEKNRLVRSYRDASTYSPDLRALRDDIQKHREEAAEQLNDLLLNEFNRLGIKYEEAVWDVKGQEMGKPKKRAVRIEDIMALHPFHWGYEFDEVMNDRGGFDAIITNPPWEIFKPNGKEFFEEYSDLVSKKSMSIHEFNDEQARLLKDRDIREAWLKYESQFPYVSAYYRSAPQYVNQISVVNGKKAGSDTNLYKLFTEQSYNLLRIDGRCGIVIPSGIYTDLGSKQLRELLFGSARVDGLFGFENRKEIFEGVHRSFKFVVLTFGKGGETKSFPAAFMRHDVAELTHFPQQESIQIPVSLIRRLSPDSVSVMEFKSELDMQIAEKMLRWPMMGDQTTGGWRLAFTAEFHMTADSYLFRDRPASGRLPLYEGKMTYQYDAHYLEPRYWVGEKEGRAAVLGKRADSRQLLDYQAYRLSFRDIASSTNERSMISTIIPPTFHGNKLPTVKIFDENNNRLVSDYDQVLLCAIWNSFAFDWLLRMKITTTLNFFYLNQMPVPRLGARDPQRGPIASRAAKLICTTPEFDDLAKELGLQGYKDGVTDAAERAQLRAELDGLIAHLYALTEQEFTQILGAFPLIGLAVKEAALNAFREFAPNPDDQQLKALITQGESGHVEFKLGIKHNPWTKQSDNTMYQNVVQGAAAFMNSEGGMILLGVDSKGNIQGLADDYQAVNNQKPGRDSYELFVRSTISNNLGADLAPFYEVSFHVIAGKDICRIRFKPATKPVFYGQDLYVRDGNQKRKLSAKEALAYQKMRWG